MSEAQLRELDWGWESDEISRLAGNDMVDKRNHKKMNVLAFVTQSSNALSTSSQPKLVLKPRANRRNHGMSTIHVLPNACSKGLHYEP